MTGPAFDLASLRRAYAAGLAPADVVRLALARLAAADDPGIFITLAEEEALVGEAAALGAFDPNRKLWGIPCAIKDNIDVAGMPTTAGCPGYAYTPERDATVVERLREAGAIVLGKTNLDQFATGLVGVRTPYPVPRNAVDARLVPGGSSSGSAVATARGIVAFALGTDTAGSGRIPAGLNNIVGLKPSFGALSTRGVVPACRTLDCVSVFALTTDDAWQVFEVAAGFDAEDPYSRDVRPHGLGAPVAGVRVGVPNADEREFFGDTDMARAYEAALAQLAALGCEVVAVPFGAFYEVAKLLYEGGWVAERYAAIRPFFDRCPEALHPATRTIYEGAKALSAADAFAGYYRLAALEAELRPVLGSVDLLCVPTAPTHYSVAEVTAEPFVLNARLGTYTNFVNLLGLCGITVPVGRRRDGLPASVTLLAAGGRDSLAASVGRKLHAAGGGTMGATGWPLPQLAALPAAPPETRVEVVVVGAHLNGLPFSGQLIQLGGRLDRCTTTTPDYKLYALAGQDVPKPGMLRVGKGQGVRVEAEVWTLTSQAFGQFVAAVPSPLSIGTVALSDGTSAKGFLVEPEGLVDATDISQFGGWRRYVASLPPG